MKKREDPLPYTRVGYCAGCRRNEDVILYRVRAGMYRYRCRDCFKAETGHEP